MLESWKTGTSGLRAARPTFPRLGAHLLPRSFNIYLLNVYHMPHAVLGPGDSAKDRTGLVPALEELTVKCHKVYNGDAAEPNSRSLGQFSWLREGL